ncbi:MAG: hypothetical protein ACKOPK_20130, partial [Dolichospermum sp.]
PLTAKSPDIAEIISQAVGADIGNYLVSVNIEVKVLEKASTPSAVSFPQVSVPTQQREAA